MLLFAEWKPLGKKDESGYIRAYELLRKIPRINGDLIQLHSFDRQVEWVEEKERLKNHKLR